MNLVEIVSLFARTSFIRCCLDKKPLSKGMFRKGLLLKCIYSRGGPDRTRVRMS